LANGRHNIIDYIVGSPAIWQTATHLKVIINDTRYCAIEGDSDHRPLRLWLNIDYTFVKPQHIVVTKNIMPRFKYDKPKVEEYQFVVTTNLGNLWVVNSIGHLGANGLVNLLQQCVGATTESTFGNKPSGRSYRRDTTINPSLMLTAIYVYTCQGGCVLILEKVPTKGICCGQDWKAYAS
jgi:hypothetical protein